MSLAGILREYQRGDSLESFSGVCLWKDFSREYHRNDSLESFSGVCLWRDLLGNSRGVTLWRVFSGLFLWRDFLRYCGVSLEGFSGEYQRGISQATITVMPHAANGLCQNDYAI